MKGILLIIGLSFLFANCSKGQSFLGAINNKIAPHSLIVFAGESNASGRAANTPALPSELGDRTGVRILNNATLQSFDVLNISSTSNGIDNTHVGENGYQTLGAQHGWELDLANSVDSGILQRPVYLAKTGEGGTKISQWIGAGSLTYTKLFPRMDSAIKLLTTLTGATPPVYIFYSQGINDVGITDTATWKASTKTHFADIRARYGQVPIFITLLPANYTTFNSKITEIASELPDCYAIQTSDAEVNDIHWTYLGMKRIATRMINTLKAHYTYY